jgi:hypothetical protein
METLGVFNYVNRPIQIGDYVHKKPKRYSRIKLRKGIVTRISGTQCVVQWDNTKTPEYVFTHELKILDFTEEEKKKDQDKKYVVIIQNKTQLPQMFSTYEEAVESAKNQLLTEQRPIFIAECIVRVELGQIKINKLK